MLAGVRPATLQGRSSRRVRVRVGIGVRVGIKVRAAVAGECVRRWRRKARYLSTVVQR